MTSGEGAELGGAIIVEGLHKRFRVPRRGRQLLRPWRRPPDNEALRGVDLSIPKGQLFTIVGPNGAGKTTLLKVLAGLITPTSGRVEVMGVDVTAAPRQARSCCGYVLSEERSFFWRLSCRDNLRFFGALQGVGGRRCEERIRELAVLLGLSEHLDRVFADLSAGQKQRVAIARGLLADPPVLLFDEATRSLDPGRAQRVRRIIRDVLVAREGKSVLFTTHDLDEAQELSHRVALIDGGRVDCEGPYESIEGRVREVFAREVEAEEEEYRRVFGEAV